jgi:hypothetical protein
MRFSFLNKWQKVEEKCHVVVKRGNEWVAYFSDMVSWLQNIARKKDTRKLCLLKKNVYISIWSWRWKEGRAFTKSTKYFKSEPPLLSSIFYINPYFLSLPLPWCFLSCASTTLLSSGFVLWFIIFTPASNFSSVFPFSSISSSVSLSKQNLLFFIYLVAS